jgi:hypothetical protein
MYLFRITKEERKLINKAKSIVLQTSDKGYVSDGDVVVKALKKFIGDESGRYNTTIRRNTKTRKYPKQ